MKRNLVRRIVGACALVGLAVGAGPVSSVGAAGDDHGPGGAADAFIEDLIGHVVEWDDQLLELEGINPLRLDLTGDESERVVELAGALYGAPSVAVNHQPPPGLEALQESFEAAAEAYAAVALAILSWYQADIDSPEEVEAEAAYHDAIAATFDPFNTFVERAEEAVGGFADGSGYLTAAQALADAWSLSLNAWYRLDPLAGTRILDDAEIDEYIEVLLTWAGTPAAAAELSAPAEYAEVHATLGALAAGYAAISDEVFAWSDTEDGSAEEAASEEAIAAALAAIDGLAADFDAAVAAAQGNGGEIDCAAPADYLDCVAALAMEWNDHLETIGRIDPIHAEMTDADVPVLQQLLGDLSAAPAVAAMLPVPAGLESVGASFAELAATFALVPDAIFGWAGEPVGSDAEAEFEAQLAALAAQLPAQTEIFLDAVDIAGAALLDEAA